LSKDIRAPQKIGVKKAVAQHTLSDVPRARRSGRCLASQTRLEASPFPGIYSAFLVKIILDKRYGLLTIERWETTLRIARNQAPETLTIQFQ
jgi:hypothetical protein